MLKKRRRKIKRGKKSHKNYFKKKGTKLITNTKKLKLKIQSRVWNFKNTMLKKRRRKKKGQKVIKNIYMKFAVKKKKGPFFFCKVIGYKSEN